ncbi:MAG: hypothetical protein IPL23_26020 [Saprospiraceae bacterium]|nr:hypothetical protein [Saprospiraceae bacterium]
MSVKHVFLLNAAIEGIGGMVFFLRPEWLLNNGQATLESIMLSKLIAFAAIIFGILSFQIFKHFQYSQLIKMVTLIFMGYHVITALNMYRFYTAELTSNPGAFIIHLLLGITFGAIFLKEREKFIN